MPTARALCKMALAPDQRNVYRLQYNSKTDFFFGWGPLVSAHYGSSGIGYKFPFMYDVYGRHCLTAPPPPQGTIDVRVRESQSHVTTDGQPVSQSWCRAPSGAHDQMFVAV
jgi:hypothetical protein